ncbi:MAG: hypothetical protein BWY79_00694 [Actinobacteria bacterium ADurb.Bin444]|nr:MAG: hypothetical protein BWY79_00694 [Actinobacteria bacterium ADurb.Bin444]
MVADCHRLRPLQVCVAGHNRILQLRGAPEQDLHDFEDALQVAADCRTQVQLQIQCNLIVAAAGRVDFATHRSHQLGEASFHRHVYVFVTEFPGELALGDLPLHFIQAVQQDVAFAAAEKAYVAKHAHVGPTAGDVVTGQDVVEGK